MRIFHDYIKFELFNNKFQPIFKLLSQKFCHPTTSYLDDGVGKNLAPLQKAGIISYEVLKSIQLKKYLNADW